MRVLHRLLVPVVLLGRAGVARAEPPAPPPSTAPFEHRPKPPSERVTLQLEDTDLSELVRVIGEMTGKRFVIASPKLAKTKASVYAPQKVTVAEAYQAFLAVLAANGLTVVPQAGFLKIVESQDVARQLTPIEKGDLPPDERYVTRIHRLSHLSAEEVATNVLSKLATKDASLVPYPAGNLLIITETAANLRRMLEVLDAIDSAGEDDKLYLQPLRYVPAAQVEKQLNAIFGLAAAEKKSSSSDGREVAGPLHVARIVALERPNAIVIVATRTSYERILKLLEPIDIAPSNEAQVRVVMLQHADAKKIVGPINDAINGVGGGAAGGAAAPRTSGAPTGTSPVLEGSAKVAADETTNSLIVTATPRDFGPIKAVIDALDRPKRQVYIEAVVLDIAIERGNDLNAAWHGGFPTSAVAGDGSQTNFGGFRPLSSITPSSNELQAFALGVRGPDIPFLKNVTGLSTIPSFGAFLSAIAISKQADIVSTPHILASDNTVAEIKVQLQTSLQPNAPQTSIIPGVPTTVGQNVNVGSTVANNFRGIGPRIKVTPHLNDSDQVRLDVDELISDIQSTPDKGDTFGTISYVERTATTTLTVKDGQTVVIGGLVRNRISRSETKVPLLGDIPLLGLLFRSRADRVEKSNLVLVLTPYIVRDQADLRRIFERKMQERQELVDRETVFTGQEWAPPRDWSRTHGLVADIRLAQLDAARRIAEAEANAPGAAGPIAAQPALDLPVPQHPQGSSTTTASKPPTPVGAVANPSRPGVLER
ncbi:MAG: type II secretion system secretin GspD [Deltaproteobacteria bacterium]|nr:type II secretion system secretin GspD [Deltaproteobacteria bacterium]